MKHHHFYTGLIVGLLIGLVLATAGIAIAGQDIKLIINGTTIDCAGTPPTIINGRTYVPARYVAEALGASVAWDADNNAVVITGQKVGGVPGDLEAVKDTTSNLTPIDNGNITVVSIGETTYTDSSQDKTIREGERKANVTITLRNNYKKELQLPGIKAIFSDGGKYHYDIDRDISPEIIKNRRYIPPNATVSFTMVAWIPDSVTVTDWKISLY